MDVVATSQIEMMQNSRHFPMTDEPDKFLDAMTRFLNGSEANGDRS
jgi:pimeloyl-ACP methyl ester carboxylesterase